MAATRTASALDPNGEYRIESESINIPIRFRGDAYLIVIADAQSKVDEYPNDGNNVAAARFYVDPVPLSDLVTSTVVALHRPCTARRSKCVSR